MSDLSLASCPRGEVLTVRLRYSLATFTMKSLDECVTGIISFAIQKGAICHRGVGIISNPIGYSRINNTCKNGRAKKSSND